MREAVQRDLPAGLASRRPDGWFGLAAAVVSLTALGLLLQSTSYLNVDIAWILYTTGTMFEGAVFGKDFISANPPLVWFLSMPVVALSLASGLHEATAFRVLVAILTLGSLCLTYWLLHHRTLGASRPYIAHFLLVASYGFFLASYQDYGQREYLAVVLALPYFVMAAARLKGADFPWQLAAAVGAAAGLGLALKPYFLAAPALIELMLVMNSRNLKPAFRPEPLAIAGTILLYLLTIFLVTPEYIFEIVPMMTTVYWGFETPLVIVLLLIVPHILGFLAALFLSRTKPEDTLLKVLLAAAAGFFVSYLVQMKGYTYHAFPPLLLAALALSCLIVRPSADERADAKKPSAWPSTTAATALFLLLAVNLLIVIHWYQNENQFNGPQAKATAEIIELVDRHAGEDYFLALNTHPYPTYVVANYSNAKPASNTNGRFYLPAIAKLRHAGRADDAGLLRVSEGHAWDRLVQDLAFEPKIILIHTNSRKHGIGDIEFDILSFYLEDERIRALWQDYREVETLTDYRVFLRRGEGSKS